MKIWTKECRSLYGIYSEDKLPGKCPPMQAWRPPAGHIAQKYCGRKLCLHKFFSRSISVPSGAAAHPTSPGAAAGGAYSTFTIVSICACTITQRTGTHSAAGSAHLGFAAVIPYIYPARTLRRLRRIRPGSAGLFLPVAPESPDPDDNKSRNYNFPYVLFHFSFPFIRPFSIS